MTAAALGPGAAPRVRRPPCPAHPRAPAAQACAGCGTFLCAECADPQPRCRRCRGEGHPVPWEDPRRDRVRAFAATLGALADPGKFFALLPWTGGLRGPLGFAVLAATLGALGSTVFGLLSALSTGPVLEGMLPLLQRSLPPGARQQLPELLDGLMQASIRMQLISLLLAPLNAALQLLVMSALTHPLARAMGGKGSFEATFRALAYAGGAGVLAALPGVGGMLGFVLGLVFATLGLRRAHGVSGGRAFLLACWWMPLALALLIAFVGLAVMVIATRIH